MTRAIVLALMTVLSLHGQTPTRRQGFEQVLVLPTASNLPKVSIEGSVVSEATGQPIAGATVTVARHYEALAALLDDTPPVSIPPVTTDERGRFAFSGLTAGAYDMLVEMKGYVAREFGQREDGYKTALSLSAGQRLEGFKASLSRSGRIAGRILNTVGDPAAEVQLVLLTGDLRDPQASARTKSSADGSYELEGFLPGDYLLLAAIQTGRNAEPAESSARQITIPNREPLRLDLSVDGKIRYAIRGKVSQKGTPAVPQTVRFNVASTLVGMNRINMPSAEAQYNPATGAFEIPNLLPGIYHMSASDNENGTCGSRDLLVSRADVTGLEIALGECK